MDMCGPCLPPKVSRLDNPNRPNSAALSTRAISTAQDGRNYSNTLKYTQSDLAVGTLISSSAGLTKPSSSVVRDLINVHLSVTEANALLTGQGGMTSKPLDLSLDGTVMMAHHPLLGTNLATGPSVTNTSSGTYNSGSHSHHSTLRAVSSSQQQSQLNPIYPVDSSEVTGFPHPVPVALTTSLAGAEAVPAAAAAASHHACRWNSCSLRFGEMEELVAHVNERHVVLAEGEYCCRWDGCSRKGKGFNARYKMLIHVRTHTNEKPHQCPICNKSFSRLENLKIHNRSHTGERPYVCPVAGCNKRYSNSSDRFKHTRTHLEEKPYFCKVAGCDKRYTDPSSLRKHVKTFGHYANRDHLNHYVSRKTVTAAISGGGAASSKPAAPRVSAAKPAPVPFFPSVTAALPPPPLPPTTSSVAGIPEGVIVYPILVHSPSLQPHYSYVTLPGHLPDFSASGNSPATFSLAGMQQNSGEATGREGQRPAVGDGFAALSQDMVVGQRSVNIESKSEGMASG